MGNVRNKFLFQLFHFTQFRGECRQFISQFRHGMVPFNLLHFPGGGRGEVAARHLLDRGGQRIPDRMMSFTC